MKHAPSHSQTGQHGFSLVELMVAMAIGLVVIGAVFSTYLHSRAGSRQTAALSQVTEDATIALGVLRAHAAMAGYSQPSDKGIDRFGIDRRLKGAAIIGCDGGFQSGENVVVPSAVTCKTVAPGTTPPPPDSLIVRYEADERNGPIVNATAPGGDPGPADCAGAALVKGTTTDTDFWVSDSRFKLDTDSNTTNNLGLKCLGSGSQATPDLTNVTDTFGNGFQPLVNNIQDLQLSYGVAGTVPKTPLDGGADENRPGSRVARYMNASEVGDPTNAIWDRVISVRVCLVVRSEEEVLEQATPYRGCSNEASPTTVITPTDRRIYRAFTTTIVLNNRI